METPHFRNRIEHWSDLNLQQILSQRDVFEDPTRIVADLLDLPAVVARAEVRRDQRVACGFLRVVDLRLLLAETTSSCGVYRRADQQPTHGFL